LIDVRSGRISPLVQSTEVCAAVSAFPIAFRSCIHIQPIPEPSPPDPVMSSWATEPCSSTVQLGTSFCESAHRIRS